MMAHGAALQRCGGFTLLELLVVIGLLSGLALMAYATVSDGENQRRFEDTANRLAAIRRAVLGNPEPVYDGQVRLSGFVADNGVIPGSLIELVTKPTGLTASAMVQPQFDPQPDNECLNNGGETPVINSAMAKGYRGPYVAVSPQAGVATYRDGWGNHSTQLPPDDSNNYGWNVTATSDNLRVASLGLGNAGGGSGHEEDISDQIADGVAPLPTPPGSPGNWRFDLTGWPVQIANRSGAATLAKLRVSVLAYRNNGTANGLWKRVTSGAVSAAIPAGGTETVTFNSFCNNGSTGGNTWVPMGRHLVVLVVDPDGIAHTTDDALQDPATPPTPPTVVVAKQVAFFAGADRPSVTLEIR